MKQKIVIGLALAMRSNQAVQEIQSQARLQRTQPLRSGVAALQQRLRLQAQSDVEAPRPHARLAAQANGPVVPVSAVSRH